MIVEPKLRVGDFIKAGADIVRVHAEVAPTIHLHRTINLVDSDQELRCKGWSGSQPWHPFSAIEYVLEEVDLILIMSVNPGFGGQSLIESQVKKIAELRKIWNQKGINPWIEVAGGVTPKNAWKVIQAGTNALVAGSAVYGPPSYLDGGIFERGLNKTLKQSPFRSDINFVSQHRDWALTLHTFAFTSDGHWLAKSSERDENVNEEGGIDLSAWLRERAYPSQTLMCGD